VHTGIEPESNQASIKSASRSLFARGEEIRYFIDTFFYANQLNHNWFIYFLFKTLEGFVLTAAIDFQFRCIILLLNSRFLLDCLVGSDEQWNFQSGSR
jgi:hypothetical protein